MRPNDREVTMALHQLEVRVTEDSADEPYLWILGFKADADTLGPPPPGSLLPSLGVKTFDARAALTSLVGTRDVTAPAVLPIPATLGTRWFTLRPALLPDSSWFSGLAGLVCMVWDEDEYAPATSDEGHKVFKKACGPALSTELTKLINGGYDDPLSRDGNQVVVSTPAGLQWRLDRLGDPAGRKNAVSAISVAVRNAIYPMIRDAMAKAAGADEFYDPDDMLGLDAVVYLGEDLGAGIRDFELKFIEDDADYLAKGHATAVPVNLAKLNSAVTTVERTFDRQGTVKMRVCWYPEKQYNAFAYRLRTTTRYELLTLKGAPAAEVRWFIDDQLLGPGEGSVAVLFEPLDAYAGPPQDILASFYNGGIGALKYRVNGTVLEVWNEDGNGVFFGKVHVVYAYAGDPPLTPPGAAPTMADWARRGYDQSADLSVTAVELVMDAAYQEDIKQCKRIVTEIDRKHIAVNWGRVIINPGDPPPFRQALLDRVAAQASVANAADVQIIARPKQLR